MFSQGQEKGSWGSEKYDGCKSSGRGLEVNKQSVTSDLRKLELL